jgi:hypothetical protein
MFISHASPEETCCLFTVSFSATDGLVSLLTLCGSQPVDMANSIIEQSSAIKEGYAFFII